MPFGMMGIGRLATRRPLSESDPAVQRDPQPQRDLLTFLDQDVLPRLGIEDVYGDVRFTSRRGRYWRAACPLHDGDNPSAFSVDTETLAWRCYSRCGSGSVVAFVNGGSVPTGITFVDAVRTLADRAGVPFPERELTPEAVARAAARERRAAMLESFLALAQESLAGDDGAMARGYLAGRGFPADRLADLGLGLYTDPVSVELHLLGAGFNAGEIEDCGLITPAWMGRLVGPWRDRRGRLATLFARAVDGAANIGTGAGAKYLYLRGASKRDLVAFGLDVALATVAGRHDLVLVEGLLDVLLLQALGVTNVAAVGGSGRELTAGRFEALAGWGVRRVTLLFDNDMAGREGTRAALEQARQATTAPIIQVVDPAALGDAKDPDELVRQDGVEAWRRVLATREPATVYGGRLLLDTVTPHSPHVERREAAQRVVAYLADHEGEDAALDTADVLRVAEERTAYDAGTLTEAVAARRTNRRREEAATALDRALAQAQNARRDGAEAAVVIAALAVELTRLQAQLATTGSLTPASADSSPRPTGSRQERGA